MKRASLARIAVVPAIAALLAGCGGGGGPSASAPAEVAPPSSVVFVEATIRPGGSLKSSLDSLARRVAGIEDLGETIVTRLEESARENGQAFDYGKDVEPWLGEKAGVFLDGYDGESFEDVGIAVQVTDPDEARQFIESRVQKSEGGAESQKSFEGIDYEVDSDGGAAIGVIGDLALFAEDEATFKKAVEAAQGESLADAGAYTEIASAAPEAAAASAYVDVGGLIRQSGSTVDPNAVRLLDAFGIDPHESTALVSLVPGSDSLELQIATKLSTDATSGPSQGSEDLLGAMPARSFAAIAAPGFGDIVRGAVDRLDAAGIPGRLAPHQLKGALARVGIDLDAITGNLGDAAIFATGSSRATLSGALVAEAKDPQEAANTVSNIGLLLRSSGVQGVTALDGRATGFAVRSAALGSRPLVVAAQGGRIAVGYGLPATLAVLSGSGPTLSSSKAFGEARSALGGTPLTGFADGPGALRLVGNLLSVDDRAAFGELRPYLSKIGFLAIGTEAAGSLQKLRVVAGLSG